MIEHQTDQVLQEKRLEQLPHRILGVMNQTSRIHGFQLIP